MKLKLYPHQKKEIWKDIKGYEGLYQVSNYGNIFTTDDFTVKVGDANAYQVISTPRKGIK